MLKSNSLYLKNEDELNIGTNPNQLEIFEEEEDEDETEYEDLTEEELMLTSIEEFFSKEEVKNVISLKQVLKYRKDITEQLKNYQNFNPFQKKIIGRRIAITYIIERYFNYMQEKIPNIDIYRYVGKIEYDELWSIRKRRRCFYE